MSFLILNIFYNFFPDKKQKPYIREHILFINSLQSIIYRQHVEVYLASRKNTKVYIKFWITGLKN